MKSSKLKIQIDPSARIMRAVRKAERGINGDGAKIGGTGFTILKMRQKPVEFLIERNRIGPEEIQAAQEINLAFYSISSRLACRGVSYDRVDGGQGSDLPWPVRIAGAVGRYQNFASHWSDRAKAFPDPTLEILISAIIDERYIGTIANDLGFSPKRIEKAVVCGLRDYAALAGWVYGARAQKWRADADFVFGPAALHLAISRGTLEREIHK